MRIINNGDQKPVLDYPCRWVYKVIGGDKQQLQELLAQTLQDYPYSVSPSHTSATGKYCCLNVEMVVPSEAVRVAIYEALQSHPAVKIVL
jgi:hypothetical protein